MSVKIRLARLGSKKRPFYRVVAADTRFPRDGRFLEIIGTYDPLQDPPRFEVDREKFDRWVGKGAIATSTVRSLLKKTASKDSGVDAG